MLCFQFWACMSSDLDMEVTGKPLDAEDYVKSLTKKYSEIYGL